MVCGCRIESVVKGDAITTIVAHTGVQRQDRHRIEKREFISPKPMCCRTRYLDLVS